MEAELEEKGWKSRRLSINSLSLHLIEAGPENGPLLILLHGFPEFWWAWRHQIIPLAEVGYRVVVPDMRGYNCSDAPPEVSSYELSILVADVLALADQYGADRFSLVGHDWGGIVAWGVGASHSERIERLVIMDAPHPDLWVKEVLTHPSQALRSTYVALFQLPWLPEAVLGTFDFAGLRTMLLNTAREGAFEPGDIEEYTKAWAHPGSLKAMLNYYRALRERKKPERPTRIQCPTLILWGEKDTFLEHYLAKASLELCDNGQLSIIQGTTHWLHSEEPAQVNARIIAFLSH
jgi:pimeloyl-ACP methyl ester carboxylesterase